MNWITFCHEEPLFLAWLRNGIGAIDCPEQIGDLMDELEIAVPMYECNPINPEMIYFANIGFQKF